MQGSFGDRIEVYGAEAGLHVTIRWKTKLAHPMRDLVARAAEMQLGIYPADGYYSRPPRAPTFVLGYTSLNPQDIREGVKRLAKLLEEYSATS